MKEKIINLLGVRSIITIALTGTLIYGFVVGKIEGKEFLVYVSMVLTFFFAKTGQEEAKKNIEEKIEIEKIPNNEKGVG
jgi:MFS-type transporter involved in bile tolerance (Atg22 family)